MGHTLQPLSHKELPAKSVFDKRFVVEVAEKFHLHYRNLRILLSLSDFIEFCQGVIKAYERWQKLGNPEPKQGSHIELCRRKVGNDVYNEGIKLNLNDNLYLKNEGRIFSEGADFTDPYYIHLKLRDLRVELSLDDFKQLAEAVKEAEKALENSNITACV